MQFRHAIGIYLGTADSCIAVYDNNQVKILPTDSKGNRSIKSCVAFDGSEFIVGNEAYNNFTSSPKNCIFDIKMLIGKTCSKLLALKAQYRWPFDIKSDEDGRPMICVTQNDLLLKFYPEQIYAMLISKLKRLAEATLGQRVYDAVISVPATFNFAQREATKLAASMAGLMSIRLIKESMAAVLPSEIKKRENCAKHVAIISIGRAKAEACLLRRSDLVFEVESFKSCSDLNGDIFDKILVDHCVKKFKELIGKEDIKIHDWRLDVLRKDCEEAKKILSFSQQTIIKTSELSPGRDFYYVLTRKEFEELCDHAFQRIGSLLQNSHEYLESVEIEKVFVIGGSAQIPKLADTISNCFPGIETVVLKDFQEEIAGGAAILAAVLININLDSDFLLLDTVGISLGIEDEDGNLVQLIPRGSAVPIKREHEIDFQRNQNLKTIKIYEGEQKIASNNLLIKEVVLSNINEFSKIKVSLEVYADNTIYVGVIVDGQVQNQLGGKLGQTNFSSF